MSSNIEAFKARVAANTQASLQSRQDSWAKRDAYFAAKDKLVSEMKAKGFKHTHGDCEICKEIESIQF